MNILKNISEFYNIPIFYKGKLLKQLREEWVVPAKKWRDYSKIKQLLDLTTASNQQGLVDKKTWYDLNMNAIFESIDTTISEVGQQILYRNMHLLEENEIELQKKYEFGNRLREDWVLREALQICLQPLSSVSLRSSIELLFRPFGFIKFSKNLVVFWCVMSVGVFLLATMMQINVLFILAFFIVGVNFYLSRRFLSFVEPYSGALSGIKAIVSVAHRLYDQKLSCSVDLFKPVEDSIVSVRRSKRLLGLLLFSQSSPNFLIGYPMYLVNLVAPVDLLIYSFLIRSVEKHFSAMRLCFDSIGELDASIALACYLERHPDHCNPELSKGLQVDFKRVRHPLVVDCIGNSFKSQGESALITGSNMAGKTTFIRVIGINVILSRTLWLCHAESAVVPACNVASSISNSDFLEQGKSYYFSELEHINRFLRLSENGEQHLFLIDEIFRGTNTVERIASSAAVLQQLAKSSIVLVTTHDRELEDYLTQLFFMWHFEETGDKENPFDYKIRSGVCKSRNALKLMAGLGFPENIVENARKIAKQVEERYPNKID